MSDVNANPDDVRKLAGALKRYQQDVRQAAKTAASAVSSARWHDSKKQQFEARLKDHQRQMDKFVGNDVEQMIRSLNELASKLDEIKRMRM